MKNRLSKLAKTASYSLVLLAACGVTSSCKDDYTWDDEKPSWLNSSIYQSLESQGKYSYYLRLIADPDVNLQNARPLSEVLSRTGSKTVFVADDDAWKAFFEKNATLPESDPWHNATSYEKLSVSQKKLLIHTSMLNNAIVMENLASNIVSGQMTRGEFMRRYTDVEATDTITYNDGTTLPVNYNHDLRKDGKTASETDYWWRFRPENGGKGLYMVQDSSLSMMVHFTNEHLKRNNVTDEDFAIFMGQERRTDDVHIYDAVLTNKDAVCENGYVNTTSKVITPLANMAEVIRTNGETNIFSHMLDRWSVPFYNRGVTEAYKNVMAARGITWTDSIFTKRYFSDKSWGGRGLKFDPYGNEFRDAASTSVSLKFDPGWNAYYGEKGNPQFDMAAMYVPNDATLWEYFTEGGGGWQLIRTYYMKEGTAEAIPYTRPTTLDELYQQIDQIPISTLNSLINNLMFNTFVGSVPSKMTKLRNDAQEQIFDADDKEHIVKGLLANNGIIYVTDKVWGPANYTSVAAPAYISKTNLVLRWAIYNGSTTNETDHMKLNYFAYLKAMQSRFAFFLPSDEAMQYYYDPISFKSTKSRMLNLFYNGQSFPIGFRMYAYDPATATIGKLYNLEKTTSTEIVSRLKDILESHTLVLEELDSIDIDVDEYYLTKNYSVVKVTRENKRIVYAQGGFQLENEDAGLEGSISSDNAGVYTQIKGIRRNNVTEKHKMSNGTTYILDSPIIPSSKSVYSHFYQTGEPTIYNGFYELCSDEMSETIIRACGLVDETHQSTKDQATELKKYQIFVRGNSPDYNIQFFNNYHYTIFVPTDAAISQAVIEHGLPTWDDIKADFDACEKNEKEQLVQTADSVRLQAKIVCLTNFIRYHFTDNSVFVDHSDIAPTEYTTSSYDNKIELFVKLNVKRENGKLMIKDANDGNWVTIDGKYNVLARDITCSKSPAGENTMNGITIDGSSFAVLHQIPQVMNFKKLTGGRYDNDWKTTEEAKRYVKRYAIPF